MPSCSIKFEVSINVVSKSIKANDGFLINSYELKSDANDVNLNKPKAIFFYIQGSEYESVLKKTEMLVSAVILGCRMIVYEKRGISYKNTVMDSCYKYSSKQIRVDDGLAVINEYLKGVDYSTPVILVGGSEGGDIASVIASKEKRITHLILISSGGGLSQETELKILLHNKPGYLGLKSEVELDSIINDIYTSSDDLKLWAGHPYRRWKSYLRDSSIIYLKNLNIPIAILHGDSDINVPVESAREIKKYFDLNDKHNVAYIEYKYVDHGFYDVNKKISIYPKVEVDLINWLYMEKLISKDEMESYSERVKNAHSEVFK
jgi:hypothetical protein